MVNGTLTASLAVVNLGELPACMHVVIADRHPQDPQMPSPKPPNLNPNNPGTAPSEAGVKMAVYYDDSYYGVNTSE